MYMFDHEVSLAAEPGDSTNYCARMHYDVCGAEKAQLDHSICVLWDAGVPWRGSPSFSLQVISLPLLSAYQLPPFPLPTQVCFLHLFVCPAPRILTAGDAPDAFALITQVRAPLAHSTAALAF